MYRVLLKAILVASMLELGISMTEILDCVDNREFQCLQNLSTKILKVNWRPISVFAKTL